MSDVWVKSFTHLKDRPHADRALAMLQRVASLVKPIMRKHGWALPVLSEFFPTSDNLVGLNVNGGEKILLRLRPAWAPDTFYEEESVVHTMLHELTHNVHGPHDSAFYAFLSKLEDEYAALKRSGYAGEGFFSPGQRLGQNVSHDVPPHLARLKALEAAEKRKRLGQMTGSGRLGGRGPGNLTPRDLAAQAAERRAQDEKSCGSARQPPRVPNPSTSRQWSCGACTLLNPPLALRCTLCQTIRPVDPAEGWTCGICGEVGMPLEFGSCSFCGEAKTASVAN